MFNRLSFSVLVAAGCMFSVVACGSTSQSVDGDSFEEGDEADLTQRASAFVGAYKSDGELRTGTPGSGDFATLELKADGTYDANVEGSIAPKVLCNRAPCTHPEAGRWNAFLSGGTQKFRVTPIGSAKRTYELAPAIDSKAIALSRNGVQQVLLGAAPAKVAKVAGYNFDGPKVLDGMPDDVACPQVLREDENACMVARGIVRRAEGCSILCSIPIAPRGKAAGFDFVGHKVLEAAPSEICTQQVREEDEACSAVKGKATGVKGCKTLCSLPIAKRGKVAGFDFTGLKILDAAASEICTQQVREEDEACAVAKGKSTGAKGCKVLCSVPIAPR